MSPTERRKKKESRRRAVTLAQEVPAMSDRITSKGLGRVEQSEPTILEPMEIEQGNSAPSSGNGVDGRHGTSNQPITNGLLSAREASPMSSNMHVDESNSSINASLLVNQARSALSMVVMDEARASGIVSPGHTGPAPVPWSCSPVQANGHGHGHGHGYGPTLFPRNGHLESQNHGPEYRRGDASEMGNGAALSLFESRVGTRALIDESLSGVGEWASGYVWRTRRG